MSLQTCGHVNMKSFKHLLRWFAKRLFHQHSFYNFLPPAQVSHCNMLTQITEPLQALIGTYLSSGDKLSYGMALAGAQSTPEERRFYINKLDTWFPYYRSHYVGVLAYKNSYVQTKTSSSPLLPIEREHFEVLGSSLKQHMVCAGSVCLGCRHMMSHKGATVPTLYCHASDPDLNMDQNDHVCCIANSDENETTPYIIEIFKWNDSESFFKSTQMACSKNCVDTISKSVETSETPVALITTQIKKVVRITPKKSIILISKTFLVSPHLTLSMDMLNSNILLRYSLQLTQPHHNISGSFLRFEADYMLVIDPNDEQSQDVSFKWSKLMSLITEDRHKPFAGIYRCDLATFDYPCQDTELMHFYVREAGVRDYSFLVFYHDNEEEEEITYSYDMTISYSEPSDGWDVRANLKLQNLEPWQHDILAGNVLWNLRVLLHEDIFCWVTVLAGGCGRRFNMNTMYYKDMDLGCDETISTDSEYDSDELMSE